MSTKNRALATVLVLYAITAGIGIATYQVSAGSTWLRFLYADIAMTVVVFIASVAKRNSSAYDPYWSLIPVYFVAGLVLLGGPFTTPVWMMAAVGCLVAAWGLRLTGSWARGWPGWHHEDWRYVDFRSNHGRLFPFTNFFGIHLVPTGMVFAGCMPLFWIFGGVDGLTAASEPLLPQAVLMVAGLVIGFAGVGFEWVADNALARFRERPSPAPSDILATGIWGVIRHPNYLGEMLFWIGLALCGLAVGAPLWSLAGVAVMLWLFLFVSIPLKERRMEKGRPGWAAHRAAVPALIPGIY